MLGRTVVLLRRDSSKDLKKLRKLAKYISRGREFYNLEASEAGVGCDLEREVGDKF